MILIKDIHPIWDEEKNNSIGKEYNSYNGLPDKIGVELQNIWLKLTEDNKELIGYGWIDYEKNNTEISIYVQESKRNKGYAYKIINYLEAEIAISDRSKTVTATIKSENEYKDKMLNVLLKCGYEHDFFNKESMKLVLNRGTDINLRKFL